MPARFSFPVGLSSRSRLFGAVFAVLACSLIAPPVAGAVTTFSLSAGTLVIGTGAGEANRIGVRPVSSNVVEVDELGAQIANLRPGSSCEKVRADRVRCTGVSSITVNLGDGADNLGCGSTCLTTSFPTEVDGGPGNDFLVTGHANDSVDGGAGNDNISTDVGNDSLDGGDGNDEFSAGRGNDEILAGPGDDLIDVAESASSPAEPDRVACQSGFDRATIDLQDTLTDRTAACEIINEAPVDEHPTVRIARRANQAQGGGALRLRLTCPEKSKRRCQGSLSLTDRAERVLGRQGYRIARGEGKTLTVDLNRRGENAVEDGKLITATARERDPQGRLKQTIVQLAVSRR
jgi:Ca2+-binding RTX toxin-like protein